MDTDRNFTPLTVYESTSYDALGRVLVNRNAGGGTETFAEYDVLGRPATRTVSKYPQNYVSTYTYSGLSTQIDVNLRGHPS